MIQTRITAYKLLLLLILLSLAGIFYLTHSPALEQEKPVARHTEPLESEIEPSRGSEVLLFEATAYCLEDGNGDGVTATGTIPQEDRTVGVDPDIIPYGTELIINGRPGYVAEDTGGAINGNRLDIYMTDREDCLQFGRQTVRVEIGGTK